jgi:hypothetical protein
MVIRILFLSANPSDEQELQTVQECNDIDDRLRSAKYRDKFDLVQRHAITTGDLVNTILRFEPRILHFSGHGSTDGALVFQDRKGKAKKVNPSALSMVFRAANKDRNINCIFLNSCYSESQAKVISKQVDCVIGNSRDVSDNAAKEFSAYFYEALGFGKNIQDAFDLASSQLRLDNPKERIPKLRYRSDINPSKIFVLDEKDENQIKDNRQVADDIAKVVEQFKKNANYAKTVKPQSTLDYVRQDGQISSIPTTASSNPSYSNLKKWFPWFGPISSA